MKKTSHQLSRRQFLAASAASALLPSLIPGSALGFNGKLSPNERLIAVVVGYGNRGSEIIGDALGNSGIQVIGACDCYRAHTERGRDRINGHYRNDDALMFSRYEDVLARGDVDFIMNSTPDHWHTKITVEACKAGKDVYCEKPLTLTPTESRQIVQAARKYNRVVMGGSQRVMEDYGHMAPVVASGALGEIKAAYASLGGPPRECYLPAQDQPDGMDWDRWLGQAPWAPYHSERSSGSYGGGWRQYSEYGNGFLADWGAHKFGGILYCVGLDHEEPVEVLPPGGPNEHDGCCAIYKNGFRLYHGGGHDIRLVGSERTYIHGDDRDRIKPLHAVDIRRYSGCAHRLIEDFAYSVRNRIRPFQDVLYAANTATVCQLINICYKTLRPLKWDAENCRIVGDEQANRMVSRVQRSPYEISVD